MLNKVIRYLDLQSARRAANAEGHGDDERGPAPVLRQYLAVSAGVIVEPWIRTYIDSGAWQFEWSAFGGRVVFGLIIGIAILPAVYKRTFDPASPISIQLAALFPLGIGWQSLFGAAAALSGGGG